MFWSCLVFCCWFFSRGGEVGGRVVLGVWFGFSFASKVILLVCCKLKLYCVKHNVGLRKQHTAIGGGRTATNLLYLVYNGM